MRELADVALGTWPWATLAVNVAGALALGVIVAGRTGPDWLPFLGVGVLGGFTTFSALATETWELARDRPGIGTLYVTVSIAAGLAAATLGLRWGERR